MNIFKKIDLFFTYRKILLNIEKDLELNYNYRIDNVFRFYTVLNIPQEMFEDPYNFRTSDINMIARNFISDYRVQFQQYLMNMGLMELFELYEIKKVDKYSYLIVYGFSVFNTKNFVTKFVMWTIGLLIFLSLSSLSYYIIKTLI
jgi:hypothetical protein